MWRGSTYHLSQASLEYFANAFNSSITHKNIRWEFIRDETFKNDGWFINLQTGETIGFDWEIRDDYWDDNDFPFSTLGQFERKFDESKSISISIQSNKKCSAIIVGWHEDFQKEEITNIQLATDSDVKENSKTRYTKHFMVFKYDEMNKFKELIYEAFNRKTYNHSLFEIIKEKESDIVTKKQICPKCGKPLKIRESKKGVSFWGCTGWKSDKTGCDYTKSLEDDNENN